MTESYDDKVLDAFLKNQGQLFDEPVAGDREEAGDFLADCLAEVCKDRQEVLSYLDNSMDTGGMTEEEIMASPEVFPIGDGRFLVVEG